MSVTGATPIAVIGIGCRFPGGVDTAGGLWRLAAEGRSTVGPVPAGRWDAARLAGAHSPEEAIKAGRGCFLDGDVWAWDPEALAVAPVEHRSMDPQFRVLMEVAREAVEDAGIPIDRVRGSRTGVYIGTYTTDNLFREARPVEDAPNSAYLFGNFTAGAAGRIGFAMDLRGPVMVVGTYCSSGLVAVDVACGALTLGECDMALAGGVQLIVSPETQYQEALLLLSRRGGCFAFDARADGYVRGEGAGILVLKRLADADRDGDRVLAVALGSAVNNDGQATRLTAPSTLMQQTLFREAVVRAGIEPGEVGLVEAHGPGTAVGDPIEYSSIDAVYGRGRGRCALGSIKTNIGHTEAVAGIAGTIKAVECLRRGLIPPNVGFETWNPSIARDEASRLFVPTSVVDWPVPDAPRLAAVCSYGVTGTNAHLVLAAQSARRARGAPGVARKADPDQARLFLASASSPEALRLTAARLADWAERAGPEDSLQDAAHTLALRRSHADHRLGVVARDHAQLCQRTRAYAKGEEVDGVVSGVPTLPPVHAGPVLVFTGQGSQRAGMCQGLLTGEPAFQAAIDEVEPLIRAEAGFSVREMIISPERLVGVDRIQPTLFAIQVALAALWRSWGVEPAAVIGQSLGEVAACVVAGGLSLPDGVRVICRRAALLATAAGGAMASVMLDADTVQADIEAAGATGVSLGVLTAPSITVVSGDAAQVEALMERWTSAGVVVRRIDVDVASHSPQMDPILDRLGAVLADVRGIEPAIRFFSTVAEDAAHPGPLDGPYWVRNQRATVRFHAAVSAALAAGHRLFIECAPYPLAVRPMLATARVDGAVDAVALGTLLQGVDDMDAFLTHLGAVHAAGYEGIDWSTHYGDGDLADVPGTAWRRTRHGGDELSYRLVSPHLVGADQHPLLGGHVQDPETPERHYWQTPVSPRRLPWLGDHRVAGVAVLPGSGMTEMILAAGARLFATDRVCATDIAISSPLILEPEPTVTVRATRAGGAARVEVLSATAEGVTIHARGSVTPLCEQEPPRPLDPTGLLTPEWRDASISDLHRHFRQRHDVQHGPAFTALERIQVHPRDDAAVALLGLHESARVSAWMMSLHPALADELVQTVVAVWIAHHVPSPGPVVVAGFDCVRVHGPAAHVRLARVRLHDADDLACTASGVLATAEGAVVAEVEGLRLKNITPPAGRFASRLSHLQWVPEPAPESRPSTTGTWAVVCDPGSIPADRLARAIQRRGAECVPVPDSAAIPSGSRGVVLALGGDRDDREPPTTARNHVARAATVIRDLGRRSPTPRLWLVARSGLASSGLRGLLRVAAYEHPELSPSGIALTDDVDEDAIAAELLDGGRSMIEVAWRDGVRHVARLQPGADVPAAIPARPGIPVRPGAAYIVSGGLGGLGLLTVAWLTSRGAGRVAVVGRSDPTSEAQALLAEWRRAGVDVVLIRGDVAAPGIAERAVAAAAAGSCALGGVLHAAGVVEDAVIDNLDRSLLDRVWRGKAEGAWRLHEATAGCELDLFVVFSSVASLIGSPGQAAYASANAFLDGLVEWRLSRGLPATGIHWGPWGSVGRGQHLAERGFLTISPADGIDALERILDAGLRQVAYSTLDLDRWVEPYPALRDSALLAGLLSGTEADDPPAVRTRLLNAAGERARRQILETFIIDQVRDLLGGTARHIGPHTSIVMLGLDSLGAVQLEQRIRRGLQVNTKPGVIWVKPSAAALADWIIDQMGIRSPADVA